MTSLSDEIARRRTFAIISHPDAGKTTLTEKLLLFGGAIQLAGEVKARGERRRARSDWMAIERERGISVSSAVMTFEHDGHVFNLLDTPGHQDFSEDTYRTLTAVDSAVMVHRRGARHRGADPQAVRGLPAARRADHHLHQQARPRGPRPVRPDRRDRADAGARRDPGELADRHGARFSRHLRSVRRCRCCCSSAASTTATRSRARRAAAACMASTTSCSPQRLPEDARRRPCASRSRWRRACAREFDLESFRAGPSDAGLFRQRAEQFRGARTVARGRRSGAAAASAAGGRRRRPAPIAPEDEAVVRFRLQGAGQYRPAAPRPHRLCADVLGPLPPRHEAEELAHRPADGGAEPGVFPGARAQPRRGGVARRHHRHPEPRHACGSATR